MKKIISALFVFVATFSLAQKATTSSAGLAFKNYQELFAAGEMDKAAVELADAKGFIDKAIVHVDTQNDAKTWMYYGFIYISIPMCAELSGNETLKSVSADSAFVWGFDALDKSKSLDKKGMYEDQIKEFCGLYRWQLSEAGIKMYDEGKYEEAAGGLMGAAMFGEAMGLKDSMFYFFGGISAYKIEKYEEASKAFEKTLEWGYKPASSASYLKDCYMKMGRNADAEKMLIDLKARFPKDKDVMIELINFYIDTDRKEDAIKVLNDAIALDPTNPILIYTAGNIYENMNDFENAEKNYLKAKELGYKEAGFALGILYFNHGADINAEANKLEFGSAEYNEKYDAMVEESKLYFNKALPYLEQAATETPNDLVVLEALKQAYGRVGNTEKFVETKKRIEEIKAGQ